MARFTIRVSSIHREPDLGAVFVYGDVERAVAFYRNFVIWAFGGRGGGFRDRRCEEGVTAFGAEEVLFVVGAFPECGVVEGDEAFVDDGRFAVIAPWCEILFIHKKQRNCLSERTHV